MTENKAQDQDKQALRDSVFAKEKTYGEKKYDFLFGNVTNFWVNLLASAGFAFWVRHAGETKIPFSEKTFKPSDVQNKFADWMSKSLKFSPTKSESIANILTLLTPGHLVMIPSVYFGEKYKAKIVEHFDRKHYGDEAMNSPELMQRHAQIEQAEKPTLWGTVVARAGTAVINSTITYAVGSHDNMLHKVGQKNNIEALEKFKGIDHIADRGGIAIGEGIKVAAPEFYKKANTVISYNKDYSREQRRDAMQFADADPSKAVINTQKYDRGLNNFIRYVTQDVIYTLIAAAVVHPIINMAKHVIPGMTYKPHVKHPTPMPVALPAKRYQFDETQVAHVTQQPLAPQVSDGPSFQVNAIQNEATLTPRAEQALAGA